MFWSCVALVNATFLRIVAPYEPGPFQHLDWLNFVILVLPRWSLWAMISLLLPLFIQRFTSSLPALVLFFLSVILFASLWDGFFNMIFFKTALDRITLWRQFSHNLGKNVIQNFSLLLLSCIGLVAWSSLTKVHYLSDKITTLEKVNAELVDQTSKNHEPMTSRHLSVRVKGKVKFIEPASIDHLRASGSYVEICTQTGRFLVVGNLKGFEAKLNGREFYRIHRSAIVRKAALESMESLPNGEFKIVTKMGAQLRLSRSYKDKVALLK